ncbi:MAG: heavy-metal-associated domain-containing protein [Acidimicrobiia bacterium]|nr:heavy-metal-associated domain-containing protein [Acidimicrobiia bacterium]
MNETATVNVRGMSCDHCVNAVSREVAGIPGVTGVEVELATGLVRIDAERPLSAAEIAAAIETAGYEVEP